MMDTTTDDTTKQFLFDLLDKDLAYYAYYKTNFNFAFILAFYFLQQKTSYYTAIFKTLHLGGDTDTNAAIVGAMMGAYHGLNNIPKNLYESICSFECDSHDPNITLTGYVRPSTYNVKKFLINMK